MIKIGREQIIALGAAFLLLLLCFLADALLIDARSLASQELAVKRETVARLEARLSSRANLHGGPASLAPPTAFLVAATKGLAGAQLQSYIAGLATTQQAVLVSASVESNREATPDSVHIQITVELPLKGLQVLLFQIESSVPYVFVEAMSVRPQGASGVGSIQDPRLNVTLSLRALWRRDAA